MELNELRVKELEKTVKYLSESLCELECLVEKQDADIAYLNEKVKELGIASARYGGVVNAPYPTHQISEPYDLHGYEGPVGP